MKRFCLQLLLLPVAVSALSADVLTPPYSETFDSQASLGAFTVINNNNDSKTWAWDSSTQAVKYSNSWMAADDYLVLPGLQLEAGKLYTFSFDCYRQSSFRTEKIAAFVGTGDTVDKLTISLLAPVEVMAAKVDNEKETKNLDFTPEASGVYYFAVQACSDGGQLNLYVDNISVTAPKTMDAPAAVSDFTVTPAPLGALKATISFAVPSTDINGQPLQELERVEIYRGDTFVTSVYVELGATEPYQCSDDNAVYGENVYRAIPYNQGGAGYEARTTVFIGNDVPVAPGDMVLRHGEGDGDAILQWSAPEADIRGLSIDAATLTYKLKHTRPSQEWYEDLADDVVGTSYSYTECTPDFPQAFYKYSVRAKNPAGEGDALFSEMWLPLGKPDVAPFTESFSGGQLEHIFRTKMEVGTGLWAMSDDDTNPEMQSVDGDNGFIMCSGGADGDVGALYSGRIDLAGVENPTLAFYYYNFDSRDAGTIRVMVSDGDGFEPLGEPVATGAGDEMAWNQAILSLADYKDKKIEIALKATLSTTKTVAIDNIRIYNQLSHDLSVIIESPAVAVTGSPCPVGLMVTNEGAETSDGFAVEIFMNGESVATVDGEDIAPGEIGRLAFQLPVSLFDKAGKIDLYAVVNYDLDENTDNNRSFTVSTMVVNRNHPRPLNLTASAAPEGNVMLAWDMPDLVNGPLASETDDFETYDSFSIGNAGEWQFVDVDGAPVDGPSDFDIPNVPAGNPASFFVMDTSGEDFVTYGFNSYSGKKCLAAVFNARGVKNDDWAISPELPGHAQAITLWARSYSSKYPDSFEILYSKTADTPDSFFSVAKFENIPSAWKEYAAQLPEGSKYFAIRYISDDAFILMVDNVTFAKAGAESMEYTLGGYNVYRDMEPVGSVGSNVTSFTDTGVTPGKHTYHVTAIYQSAGESDPSEPVMADVSSIGTVATDTAISVVGTVGKIIVNGGCGLTTEVWSVDGRLISHVRDARSIPAGPGIYIVKIANSTFRVAVR